MNEAQVSVIDNLPDYKESLDAGGPDIAHIFGAPNEYEAKTRFYGGQSDLIHNHNHGNNLDGKILIMPEDIQEATPDKEINILEEEGVQIQTPDRELYTTADDWKSVRDIASDGDRIHGYTSDYHGIKTHLSAKAAPNSFQNNSVHTFAFPTEPSERQNILKHNVLSQTGDTLRQLYKMAKSEEL